MSDENETETEAPEQTYRSAVNGLTCHGDPDAPTGPLTPGQVMCTVCRLDDRTRAATDPNDLQCSVCRANEPIRLEKQHRRAVKLGPPRPDPSTREARFRKAVEEFYGLGEWDSIHDDETTAGSAERDLRHEEVDALLKLADMLDGHPLPEELMTAAGLGVRETEARAQPMRMVGGQLPCGPPKPIPELEDVAAAPQAIRDNPPQLPEPPIVSHRWRDETRANVEAMKQVSTVEVTVHGEGPLLMWVGALLASLGVESTVTMPAPLVENEFGTFCKFCSARVGMLHTSVCHVDGVVGQPTVLPYAGDPNAPMFRFSEEQESDR